MPSTFDSFSEKTTLALNDKFVGFDETSLGGEKKWKYSTLLRSLSSDFTLSNLNTNTVFGRNAFISNTTGANNTAVGVNALSANTAGESNTAVGASALYTNTTGNFNTAVGGGALYSNTTGSNNTATGVNALKSNTIGYSNTATGANALQSNTTGLYNTAVGASALQSNTTGESNTATGTNALKSNTTGTSNTATGTNALSANTEGFNNTATGFGALYINTGGDSNTASGVYALRNNTTGNFNTAVGASALYSNTTGLYNTAVGLNSLYTNTTGESNTAVGVDALYNNTGGDFNTAVGYQALNTISNPLSTNCTGLGYGAQVTGSNQVQLGNSSTTTYVYGTVQNRSDIRDKADIRDTQLGLDFISSLRPVDYKWDYREDYRPEAPKSVGIPIEPREDASEEEKAKYAEELAAYDAYVVANDKWLEDVKLANITHDGSKKRNRFHHGLIAQEVKSVLDSKGIDFGGFQDHKIKGGDDVLSIGYDELIAPLIKAVQELSEQNKSLEARLAALESK